MNMLDLCQEHAGLSSIRRLEGLMARPQSKLECAAIGECAGLPVLFSSSNFLSFLLATFQSTWCWLV